MVHHHTLDAGAWNLAEEEAWKAQTSNIGLSIAHRACALPKQGTVVEITTIREIVMCASHSQNSLGMGESSA